VGTEDFKPLKVFAGATGFGLSRNVRQLYKELVRLYDPGDQIYLFGFSRGAFTVRTLAGMIANCGILNVKNIETAHSLEETVRKAYRVYRLRYRTALSQLFGATIDEETIKRFREKHCLPGETPITFIGVWDTVDAVGLPFHLGDLINLTVYRFKFPDANLNSSVQRACHALSIDDARASFFPLIWEKDDGRIEQVWFAGAHSNVGGGYPKQGMSLVALDWMLSKAQDAGLRLLDLDRSIYFEHANVDDKLYDPRAGLGIFYRWKPRDMSTMCAERNVDPVIHLSVLERIAHGTEDYAPGNLAPNARIAITPVGVESMDASARERAIEVEHVLNSAHDSGKPVLSRVRSSIVLGRASYYVYLSACGATVLAVAATGIGNPLRAMAQFAKNALTFVFNVVTLQFDEVFSSLRQVAPWLLGFLILGFVLSFALSFWADGRMSAAFSQFWHKVQPDLRDALKRARETSARSLELGRPAGHA
jgi:hypothetical protein